MICSSTQTVERDNYIAALSTSDSYATPPDDHALDAGESCHEVLDASPAVPDSRTKGANSASHNRLSVVRMVSCGSNHLRHNSMPEWRNADVQVIVRRTPPADDPPLSTGQVRVHRELPNPFGIAELRDLGGLDAPVQRFLQALPEWQKMMADTLTAIRTHLTTGRSVVTVAVMCSGGHDRSVATAELLVKEIKAWPETDAFARHLHLYRRHPWVPADGRLGR